MRAGASQSAAATARPVTASARFVLWGHRVEEQTREMIRTTVTIEGKTYGLSQGTDVADLKESATRCR